MRDPTLQFATTTTTTTTTTRTRTRSTATARYVTKPWPRLARGSFIQEDDRRRRLGRQEVGMRETFRQSSLISGNVPRNRSIAEIGADACTCSPTVQIMHVPWKEKRYAAHLRRTYLQQSYPIPYFEAFVSLFFFFFFFFNTFTFLVEKSDWD